MPQSFIGPRQYPPAQDPFDPTTDPYLADPSVKALMELNQQKQRQGWQKEMPPPPKPPEQSYPLDLGPYGDWRGMAAHSSGPDEMNAAPWETEQDFVNTAPVQGLQAAAPAASPAITPQGGDITKSPMQANWPIELQGLQEKRKSEAEDVLASGGDASGTGKFQSNIASLGRDIEGSPFTGAVPHAQQRAFEALQQQATLGGFASPQEMKAYEQKQEQAKMNVPIEAQRVLGQQNLAQEQEKQRGGLAIQESMGAQAQNFMDMLQQARLGGEPSRNLNRLSLNPSGAISVGFEPSQRPSSTILKSVQTAREKYLTARGLGIFTNAPAEKASLDQAIQSGVQQHHAEQGIKEAALKWANNPAYANMTAADIAQRLGETDLTPAEIADLDELIHMIRGN